MSPYVWARFTRRQFSIRLGTRSLGVRSATQREFLPGWHTARLPFRWVAFYRKDPS